MINLLFVFDCGDFINPEADDTLKYWADLLSRHKIKGCFNVVGETARVLRERGRKDVIKSLSKHEIGYHSDFHSIPPTFAEYLNEMDWDSGVNEVIKRVKKVIDFYKK